MNRPIDSRLRTRLTLGLQCICCGHVEAPAEDLLRGPVRGLVACPKCGSADLRPFAQERRP